MSDFGSPPNSTPAFIVIDAGTVTASYIDGAEGRRAVPEDIGKFHFYVTLFEADGTRLGLWSGEDYEDAMRQAEDARRAYQIDEPVHDNVAGGW